MTGSDTKTAVLITVIIAVLACAAYFNSFIVPFQFDGEKLIAGNPALKSFEGALKLSGGINRSVTNLTYYLNYAAGGTAVPGYHLVNFLIHVFNCLLIFLLVRDTLELMEWEDGRNGTYIAGVSSLLFAVHPVHTEAVTYIYQRSTLLVTFFFLLGILLYERAREMKNRSRRNAMYAMCAVSGILALLSKPNAVTLPFFILVYDFIFPGGFKFSRKKAVVLFLILAIGVTGIFSWLVTAQKDIPGSWEGKYESRGFTGTERVMTQFRVVSYYLSLVFFPRPSRLRIEYDFVVSKGLFDPLSTLAGLIFLLLLIAASMVLLKKHTLFSFAVVWYLGTIALESSFIPLMMAAEHRIYLPSVFIFPLFAAGIHRIAYPRGRKNAGGRVSEYLFRRENMLIVPVLALLIFWTHERNEVWRSRKTLWADALEKSPDSARLHDQMSSMLMDEGRYEKALAQAKRALELDPDDYRAHALMGRALAAMGRKSEAAGAFRDALEANPRDAGSMEALGKIYGEAGKLNTAKDLIERAVKLRPGSASYHNSLGIVLAGLGDYTGALEEFGKALKIDPGYATAHYNMAMAYRSMGKTAEYKAHMEKAQSLSRNRIHNN